MGTLVEHCCALVFAKMQLGYHTILALVLRPAVGVLVSVLTRNVFMTIVPFEPLVDAIPAILIDQVLYRKSKIIPVKDKLTGETRRWEIGT